VSATGYELQGRMRLRGGETPPSLRAFNTFFYAYKRTWRGSIFTSFLYPVLYLTAMGVGLGTLVNAHHRLEGVDYVTYIAPGLLAGTAMQIGTNEATYPVMAAIKWIKTYFAMLASPLDVFDVFAGHLAWIGARVLMVATIFLGTMAAFGTIVSPYAVFALPAAVLTGLAFAAPVMAFSATQTNDTGFSILYRFVMIPLFLFSGTFFPVSQLPSWLQAIAVLTPLYHGVALCRSLTLGTVSAWPDLGHALYLLVLAGVGAVIGYRNYRKRLIT
jgi:lipooligosaccharide transport system permease protein